MTTPLIVALDFDNQQDLARLLDVLDPRLCALKIGNEMFTRFGANLVKSLINKQFKVFLTLKFHDIPNTVAQACRACADLGVWMINLHAQGGLRMMQAAKLALEAYGTERPLLIAVTVLTSFNESELASVGVCHSLLTQVTHLALLGKEAGLDGVVCSAHEVKSIKEQCGQSFIAVTPGIRLNTNSADDQSRIMTPQQAIKEGSNYLVIGRPITQAPNPGEVVADIVSTFSI